MFEIKQIEDFFCVGVQAGLFLFFVGYAVKTPSEQKLQSIMPAAKPLCSLPNKSCICSVGAARKKMLCN